MANSDEEPTIDDPEDALWAGQQRQVVVKYLSLQGCNHAGVSLEPRWYFPPFVALWAVRSISNPDAVGWWAISGDVPTDYITAARELRSQADVLAAFGTLWQNAARSMAQGDHAGIGKPEDARTLAPMLEARAQMLLDIAEQLRAKDSQEAQE